MRWGTIGVQIAAAVGGGFLVLVGLGSLGWINLPFVLAHLPDGIGPATVSLEITVVSFVLGFGLALPIALVRTYPPSWRPRRRFGTAPPSDPRRAVPIARGARWIAYGVASGYVAAIRGTPFLVQVFLVYYAVIFTVPRLTFLGVGAPFWAGLLALTINTTAYQSEALRG